METRLLDLMSPVCVSGAGGYGRPKKVSGCEEGFPQINTHQVLGVTVSDLQGDCDPHGIHVFPPGPLPHGTDVLGKLRATLILT